MNQYGMKRTGLIMSLFLTLFLMSCRTDGMLLRRQKLDSFSLMAKVFNGENRACSSVMVEMTNSQGKEYRAKTDVTGKAIFPDLPFEQYEVTLSKEGYETVSFDFPYDNEGQALYGRLFSEDQLVRLSRKSMDKGEWEKALSYLDRAFSIGEEDWERLFLRAIILWKQGESEEAEEILKTGNGETMPGEVLLFYADLLQYDRNKRDEAYIVLGKIMAQRPSDDIKERIALLADQIEKGRKTNEE